MENILFLVQYNSMGSSSRGKMSGGVALRLEDLCDKDFMKKVLTGHYNLMYASPRCSYNNIIHMPKDEFEKIFKDNIEKVRYLITEYKIFRKEIFDAYSGIDKPKLKLIKKLISGHVYLGEDLNKYVYLGKVEFTGSLEKSIITKTKGNLFIVIYNESGDVTEYVKSFLLRKIEHRYKKDIDKLFLKGIKKLTEDLGECNIDFEELKNVTATLGKCYLYHYERTAEFKLNRIDE